MKKDKAILLLNKVFNKTYFTFSEVMCKCGCETFKGDPEFLEKLLRFRVIYGTPFTPRSVYRCPKHKDYSLNHNGHAADIPYQKGNSVQRLKIVKAALGAGFSRIGISYDFVHIDNNPKYNNTMLEEVLWVYPNKKGK